MYKLSREYLGHEQDVRAVVTHGSAIYSASRDGSVREWQTEGDLSSETRQYRTHQGFVNSIAFHDRYVVSGGQDGTINLVKPESQNPDYTLIGHSSNVCALHSDQDFISSGSWDGTAKLWKDGQCLHTMEGHEGAVWAVLSTQHGVLTGGADKTIRLWRDGRQLKNLPAGKDCVRALALHPLGFVSAGNDSIIRVHTFDGEIVQQLEGHDSFIYSLAVTTDGTIYSAGEDRTLRVWKDGGNVQTIVHPAVSVWTVTLLSNGDVVTGASDATVRVFTTSKERTAPTAVLKAYDESVAASAVPAQATNIPNNLPGLEALAKPGKKEGEVIMIRTAPELVEAHQWSGGVWTKVGEVVGASSKKVEYEGKEWDYVFDVDIAEGAPPLKLPYNIEENPYEAANRFIAKYELDTGFQAQIVKFIESNTGGRPLGVPREPIASNTDLTSTSSSTLTPHLVMLTMTAGNPAPIKKKLLEFASVQGNPSLEHIEKIDSTKPSSADLEGLISIVTSWPRDRLFPCLDLLRMCIVCAPHGSKIGQFLDVIIPAAEFKYAAGNDKTRETNMMLGLRFIANCYTVDKSASVLQDRAETIIDAMSAVDVYTNRNLSLALATCMLNTSIAAFRSQSSIDAINLIEVNLRLLQNSNDPEVRFRALVAFGTILRISEDVVEAARDVFEARQVLKALKEPQEERITLAIQEIQTLLHS